MCKRREGPHRKRGSPAEFDASIRDCVAASAKARVGIAVSMLLAGACAGVPGRLDDKPVPTVGVLLGRRSLRNDAFSSRDVEDQLTLGSSFDVYWKPAPAIGFGLEMLLATSFDAAESGLEDLHAGTGEFAGGGRVTLELGDSGLRLYAGAGVAAIYASLDLDAGGRDHDQSGAVYAHAGGVWVIHQFVLGVDCRVLRDSDVRLDGEHVDADYDQIALFLGGSL